MEINVIQQQEWTAKLNDKITKLPFPIAIACSRFVENPPADPWQEWERLSRDILTPVLQYLSHLMLSDLVATGQKPPHLYHRIQSVLSRPMAGHYAGFLRETARFYYDKNIHSRIPELIDFIYRAEVEKTLSGKVDEPLLGRLVDFRNLFAHGRIDDNKVVEGIAAEVRDLTARLLEGIAFLAKYPIELEDGTPLMGAHAKPPVGAPQAVVVRVEGLVLRPLLLKLKKNDLMLLEDHDLRDKKMVYRGTSSYEKLGKKDTKSGEGQALMQCLVELLGKVRSEDAMLEQLDWETFRERARVLTERTLSLYEDMRKHVPKWYVPRQEWEGENGLFAKFLGSDKTLLSLNGAQGTGKSALVSHLARGCADEGHAVLLVNAQRFTFADVTWSGNPYAEYFARELHTSRPLDREGFRSIIKRAPENRQVILFIDAVNEVDGILSKWNRFKALELLLEWVSQIAQPGLKVVVSFRLDIYLEYEYLQEDDLPKNLNEISFPGDNPQKNWVTDLKAFDEEQAQRLFDRLQTLPEMGMAPAMTWGQLKTSLGNNLVEFTTNPLIFTVLLKSHHKQAQISIKDRDDLFFKYAERLTGAIELKTWPWWKKVWGFIKNGNITKKEQFLADMIEKTSEEGGAAFLAENLNLQKKRDKRMLSIINDPGNTSFKDLQEGGLITEEKIEQKNGEKEISLRRITFVAELMDVATERILRKFNKLQQIRQTLFFVFFSLFVFPILILPLIIVDLNSMQAKMLFVGLSPNTMSLIKGNFIRVYQLFPISMFILSLTTSVMLIWAKFAPSRKAIGLIPRSFERARDLSTLKVQFFLGFLALAWVFVSIMFIGLAYSHGNKSSIELGSAPLVGIAILSLSFVIPPFSSIIYRVNPLSVPCNVVRKSTKVWLLYALSEDYRRKNKKRLISVVLWMLIPFTILFVYRLFVHWNTIPSTMVIGYQRLLSYIPLKNILLSIPMFFNKVFSGIIFSFLAVALLVVGWFFVQSKFQIATYRSILRDAKKKKIHLFYLKVLLISVVLNSILIGLVLGYQNWNHRMTVLALGDEKMFLEREKIGTSNYLFKEGKGTVDLNLSSCSKSQLERILERHWEALGKLKLPSYYKVPIDWKLMPEIKTFEGSMLVIGDLKELKNMETLTVSDMDIWLKSNRIIDDCPSVHTLKVIDYISNYCPLQRLFPNLTNLIIDDELIRGRFHVFPENFEINLFLTIQSKESPKLDWLQPVHCKYIINLKKPFNKNTQNLSLIKRLVIAGDELVPQKLEKVINLRWLAISLKKKPIQEYWRQLQVVLTEHLRKMEVLDLLPKVAEDSDFKMLKSAQGKAEMNKMIDHVINDGNWLFAAPKKQP